MSENFSNALGGVLAADITSGATSFDLVAGGGNNLPTSNFRLVLSDGTIGAGGKLSTIEVIFVTTRSGDSLSGVIRGYESSLAGGSARAWAAGTKAYHLPTAGMLQDIRDDLPNTESKKWDNMPIGTCQPFVESVMGSPIATWLAAHPKWDKLDNSIISGIEGRAMAVAGNSHAADTQAGSDNAVVVSHTHDGSTGDDAPDHTHSYHDPSYGGTAETQTENAYVSRDAPTHQTGGASQKHQHDFTTNSTGESGTDKNIQRTQYLDWIIKVS